MLLASCNKKKDYSKVKLNNELDTASYYLGIFWGKNAQNGGLEELNYEALARGLQAAFENDTTIPPSYIMQNYLQLFSVKRMFKDYKAENEKFLEENAKKDSVQTLPSGLQYIILTEGSGPRPLAEDTVAVNYIGKTIDGIEFDNSYKRGNPVEFNVSGVIKGWTEGLQLMSVGSKYKFFIPYQLGYGEMGSQRIKPYSTLIFEVELLSVKEGN
ncbi:MAG: FKBP-type peptidyl-prolyl cis-trans isomerase [Bacteroidales bacterium]|nr:FKBP-type peptidyl-prolyl cis-trans isomerase [Bacteroidales bacterium]MBN2764211.1 FKBP-type peptidyl-prolyl cis-trans isomerase [Bacteroidales bacterium]